jgi:hypothetical protein
MATGFIDIEKFLGVQIQFNPNTSKFRAHLAGVLYEERILDKLKATIAEARAAAKHTVDLAVAIRGRHMDNPSDARVDLYTVSGVMFEKERGHPGKLFLKTNQGQRSFALHYVIPDPDLMEQIGALKAEWVASNDAFSDRLLKLFEQFKETTDESILKSLLTGEPLQPKHVPAKEAAI